MEMKKIILEHFDAAWYSGRGRKVSLSNAHGFLGR